MTDPQAIQLFQAPADGAERLTELFRRYPYKRAQQRLQGLNPERLVEFYAARLKRSLEGGAEIWALRRADRAIAMGAIAPDPWHTEIYDLRMARIEPWLNTEHPGEGERLLERLLDRAREGGYEHLSVRLDGEDFANLHLMESAGFRLVDVSLKFFRPMPWTEPIAPKPDAWRRVRPAAGKDAAWLAEAGARVHARNHFFNDPALEAGRTRAMFGAWVQRCAARLAWRIYIVENAAGTPDGFVIYLRNRGFEGAIERKPIVLDYVILDEGARGSGVGPWLIQETLMRESAEGFDYCELRTSQDNYAAVGCYEKLGFRLCATDFVLHRRL